MTQRTFGAPIGAAITGTGRFVPDDVWTSEMVEARVAEASGGTRLPKGIIHLAAGVDERRYAPAGMASSDLATRASERALAAAGLSARDIDLLIFASASHDVAEPATANIVQLALGCENAAVVDVKNACNSFLNGLDVAQAFIETGRATRVLVAAGECLSPTIRWDVGGSADLSTRLAALTLGDAGAACVVEASVVPERGLRQGVFESDGTHWELSTVLGGGSRYGAAPELMFFECSSSKLQQLAVSRLPALVNDVLVKLDWTLDDVALVVPHQVSRAVIDRIAALVGYPAERCMVTLDRYGNTAAASIPFALDLAIEEGRVGAGDKVLLVGAAAGFSAAVIPLVL
ncbi:MAG TPA: ketoacyl-ACP synthase III [Acidimicrobiia bacterium]|nr:ketoacyl-ACP synthase III [Acidimicrobiia bacterium]